MADFKFYQDTLTTIIRRVELNVEADSYEEAVEKMKHVENMEDIEDEFYSYGDSEYLMETEVDMAPHQNGGRPTVTIFDPNIQDDIADNVNGFYERK